jgi:hypothetical protein
MRELPCQLKGSNGEVLTFFVKFNVVRWRQPVKAVMWTLFVVI